MDKNKQTGLLIIGLLLIAWTYFMAPDAETVKKQREAQQEEGDRRDVQQNAPLDYRGKPATNSGAPQTTAQVDSTKLFASAYSGAEEFHVLENEKVKLTFSNKGGRIYSAELKDFTTSEGEPVILFDGPENQFSYQFFTQNDAIETGKLAFSMENASKNSVSYKLYASADAYIEQIFTLNPDDYMVDLDLRFINMDKFIPIRETSFKLVWANELLKQEKRIESERLASYMYFKEANGDIDYLGRKDEKDLQLATQWISQKQQFFNSTLIASNNFDNLVLRKSEPKEEDKKFNEVVKYFEVEATIPYKSSPNFHFPMQYYVGPNDYALLKAYDKGLEANVDLGWRIFGWVNSRFIIPLFNFLNKYIASYGIIILLMTILIKLLLFPLTARSYKSMAKMKVLKPEIDAIKAKYPDDQQKQQMETMKLYGQAGASPLGGCLPTLLQMPILFAMYRFFPSSIELRQEAFLWADDLSTYDSIFDFPAGFEIPFYGDHISLFTLLMTVSTFIYMRMQSSMQSSGNDMMAMQMKMMQYFMPVMLLFFFNNFASGLTYYFFLSNMFTYAQQWVIKRFFIDEDKLRLELKENQKKPKKVSKFRQRLEDMQRQQADLQKKQSKTKSRSKKKK